MPKNSPPQSLPALTPAQLELIAERAEILKWLSSAKDREMEIRRQLAAELFPDPKEGTNNAVTADGFVLSLKHTITRKLDEVALDAVMPELAEEFRVLGKLIAYKPTLVLDGYRTMPDDQRKIFQQALTEEPGAPSLDIEKVETPVMDNHEAIKAETEARWEKLGVRLPDDGKISKAEVTPTMRAIARAHEKNPKPLGAPAKGSKADKKAKKGKK